MKNPETWPDSIDMLAITLVATLGLGMPLLGYVFLTLDYRAYLRSLRRALVVARGYATLTPEWAKRHTPPSLAVFGLELPCTQADVLRAYRARVKDAHPDRGGSRREFARLQKHFEEAMALAADAE